MHIFQTLVCCFRRNTNCLMNFEQTITLYSSNSMSFPKSINMTGKLLQQRRSRTKLVILWIQRCHPTGQDVQVLNRFFGHISCFGCTEKTKTVLESVIFADFCSYKTLKLNNFSNTIYEISKQNLIKYLNKIRFQIPLKIIAFQKISISEKSGK